MTYDLTDPQKEALQQIRDIMGEHFSSALFVYEIEDPDNSYNSDYCYACNCSYIRALGLAEYAKDAILHPPDVEDE